MGSVARLVGYGIGTRHRFVVAGNVQTKIQKLARLIGLNGFAVFGNQIKRGHGLAFLFLALDNEGPLPFPMPGLILC